MSLTDKRKTRGSLINRWRIFTYSLLLLWALEYFLVQPALVTIDQLPLPQPELLPLAQRLEKHVSFLASSDLKGRAPGTSGNATAEKFLLEQFADLGLVSPSPIGQRTQRITHVIGNNIFSALPWADFGRPWILLGAHFDHLGEQNGKFYPGADDNASSVAIILETARLLMDSNRLNQFNILFVAFNSEESPYFLTQWMGSHHFYNHIQEIGIKPHDIKLAIILDLMGGIFWKPLQDTIFIMGSEKSPELEFLLSLVKIPGIKVRPLGISMIEKIPGQGRFIFSDYQVFRTNAIPYLFLSSGRTPHYHRPTDTAEKLHYPRMARTALWFEQLIQKIDRLDKGWTYKKKRRNLKQDFQTLEPMVILAADWKTRIPQTGPISLYKLKQDLKRMQLIKEKTRTRNPLTSKDARVLELVSIRIQCLLGKMGPCFLLPTDPG